MAQAEDRIFKGLPGLECRDLHSPRSRRSILVAEIGRTCGVRIDSAFDTQVALTNVKLRNNCRGQS